MGDKWVITLIFRVVSGVKKVVPQNLRDAHTRAYVCECAINIVPFARGGIWSPGVSGSVVLELEVASQAEAWYRAK